MIFLELQHLYGTTHRVNNVLVSVMAVTPSLRPGQLRVCHLSQAKLSTNDISHKPRALRTASACWSSLLIQSHLASCIMALHIRGDHAVLSPASPRAPGPVNHPEPPASALSVRSVMINSSDAATPETGRSLRVPSHRCLRFNGVFVADGFAGPANQLPSVSPRSASSPLSM